MVCETPDFELSTHKEPIDNSLASMMLMYSTFIHVLIYTYACTGMCIIVKKLYTSTSIG